MALPALHKSQSIRETLPSGSPPCSAPVCDTAARPAWGVKLPLWDVWWDHGVVRARGRNVWEQCHHVTLVPRVTDLVSPM